MWKYHGQTIKEGKAWTDLSGVQHPANWNIWPKEHKESLGLVRLFLKLRQIVIFMMVTESDGTITKTAKALDDTVGDDIVRGVKYNLKQEVKNQQGSLLAQTDWAIVRKADKDIAVPSNIQTWRDAIRTKATEMETAIDNAADTDAVAALFLTYTTNEDGSQTKSGILYDWPELGD